MEAAYRCLAQPHDRPIRMSTILGRSGLSSRAFYRHFSSKDDLFLALLQQECDALTARLDRIVEDGVGSPADQLSSWIATMFDAVADPQRLMHFAVADSDEVRAAKGYREARERFHDERERSLAEILSRGRRDGTLPLADPGIDALAISALVSRVITGQKVEDRQAFAHARTRVTEFALRAVGALGAGR
ncbi:TetR family transcriptional regulator [Mycolicibacterium duvalii]|nr:TetR/AcrR family transcriptional regulator [Mycolicibacterium duvalii]PEG36776.1 TetR family transcriptional regulator [Mycolicibacterium duvalii]